MLSQIAAYFMTSGLPALMVCVVFPILHEVHEQTALMAMNQRSFHCGRAAKLLNEIDKNKSIKLASI